MLNVLRGFILSLLIATSPVMAGKMTLLGAGLPGTAAPPGYTGPGDVVASATAWWGLRCYNTAYAGNVVDVWDAATGNTTETLITCSSGGVLNTSSPTALATTCASGCVVKTLYDQSGALACVGSVACDLTQPTNANRLSYVQSCIGSLPCMQSVSYANKYVTKSINTFALSQPYTISTVAIRTGSVTSQNDIFSQGGAVQFIFQSSANTVLIYASGGVAPVSQTDSSWHAMQGVFNGASSSLLVDATANTALNIGAQAIMSANDIEIGGLNHGLQGNITEVGVWGITFSGTQQSNMCHNQFVYWGTSTSC